jgi:hypothetical protein
MTTRSQTMRSVLLVLTWAQLQRLSFGFQPVRSRFQAPLKESHNFRHESLYAVQQEEETSTAATADSSLPPPLPLPSGVNEEAARLRKEAEIMRLQAEQMDMSLTLQKIETLETKLKNKSWLAKNPDKEAELQTQLQRLNDKLANAGNNASPKSETAATVKPIAPSSVESSSLSSESSSTPKVEKGSVGSSSSSRSLEPSASSGKKKKLPVTPLAGFDQEDLDLYIPIANDINKLLPDADVAEKLEAFRTAPELQDHFQKKIQGMLVGPLEEMQKLETLRQEFLDSNSSKERERLKREIEKLEEGLEQDGPFMYSEGFYLEDLAPITEEELARRLEAVGNLPDILIAIYKQRNNLGDEDDLSLGIQMDYYEPQLQLLEQVRMIDPLPDEMREEYIRGFDSLPKPVQERFAKNMGVDGDSDAATVLKSALEESSILSLSPLMQVVEASNVNADPAEYNDIEFVDRSRFLEEFVPAVGGMEGKHPSEEDAKSFVSEVFDRKSFMVTSKPERVAGGYYIRGTNLFEDDEDGAKTAADKLVAHVNEKLQSSALAEKLDFFYIIDPSPPTDEELEFGETEKPVFVITTRDRESLYRWAKPQTKIGITLAGLLTTFMFTVGSCALNPSITDRFSKTLDDAGSTGVLDLQWFADLCVPMFIAFLSIQLAHELSHRVIALRDKVSIIRCRYESSTLLDTIAKHLTRAFHFLQFDIGLPTVIPSITTGLTGAITPLRSPPPNSKSMFDFAIAGPLAGIFVSLALLLNGLDLTASATFGTQLPVVPVDLLRSSSLGGGLVEYFLGNTSLLPGQGPAAVLPLHPYAIAGFVGLMTNALALLPLGRKCGCLKYDL